MERLHDRATQEFDHTHEGTAVSQFRSPRASRPRRCIPRLESLENRDVPSGLVGDLKEEPPGPPPPPPPPPPLDLPRTGGIAVQSGSAVEVFVVNHTLNTVNLREKGDGKIQAEWDGGKVHTFSHVREFYVHSIAGPVELNVNGHPTAHFVHGTAKLPVTQ